MKIDDEWDEEHDEEMVELLRRTFSSEEEVPRDVQARTRALLRAEIAAMQEMSWRATAGVTAAAGVVLVAYGSAELTLSSLLAGVAVAVVYGISFRTLVGRSA